VTVEGLSAGLSDLVDVSVGAGSGLSPVGVDEPRVFQSAKVAVKPSGVGPLETERLKAFGEFVAVGGLLEQQQQ
jgi:hypothetical protein